MIIKKSKAEVPIQEMRALTLVMQNHELHYEVDISLFYIGSFVP